MRLYRSASRCPSRTAILLLASSAALLSAEEARAQTCPASSEFLAGSTGDGSTFPAPPGVQLWARGPGCPDSFCTQPGWGFTPPSQTLQLTFSVGTWDLQGQNFYYFTPPTANGAVTCIDDPYPCGFHCTGSASFVFYAVQGSISGNVIQLPEGTPPAAGTGVGAHSPVCGTGEHNTGATSTDSSGFYTFKPTSTSNNWGLPVFFGGSGPGSSTWQVSAATCDQSASTTMTSSKMETVNLTIRSPYVEERRCRNISRRESQSASNSGGNREAS